MHLKSIVPGSLRRKEKYSLKGITQRIIKSLGLLRESN